MVSPASFIVLNNIIWKIHRKNRYMIGVYNSDVMEKGNRMAYMLQKLIYYMIFLENILLTLKD